MKAKSIPDKHICISDDSGLCVDALDGFPGIYSARFAKKNGGWYEAMNKLYKLILQKKVKNFNASFYCVITLKWYDKWIKSFFQEESMVTLLGPQEVQMALVTIHFLSQQVSTKHLVR